jgi:hypothetical protein
MMTDHVAEQKPQQPLPDVLVDCPTTFWINDCRYELHTDSTEALGTNKWFDSSILQSTFKYS